MPSHPDLTVPATRNGLVLAGAAALGAYEVGVVQYLLEDLGRELDQPISLDVLSGSSAGAINVSALAALADDPIGRSVRLRDAWTQLRLGRILRPSAVQILEMILDVGGVERWSRLCRRALVARGGLLDARPIERLLADMIPFGRIDENLRAGHLTGLAVSTTQVATGRAVIFFEAAGPVAPWGGEPNIVPVSERIGIEHVMASAAIPLLFPAVSIDGDLYVDGGLRQIVPLSPAIHLGADRLVLVNPLPSPGPAGAHVEDVRRQSLTSPIYLAGKALSALFTDRMEADLGRIEQLNAVLAAGRRRFGPTFEAEINAELGTLGKPALRRVQAVEIKPTTNLGVIASEVARSDELARRERGPAGRLLRHLASGDPARSGDLLSYLLFDGAFAARLIEQGRADARAKRDELVELLMGSNAMDRSAAGS